MAQGGQPARLERLTAATFGQMQTALVFLSLFSPDEFDHAMDVAQSADEDDQPGATGKAEPVCAICSGSIGIFLNLGLDWRHFVGDSVTAGEQLTYDPGHVPEVTWRLPDDQDDQ
jgi:hypothetical protein